MAKKQTELPGTKMSREEAEKKLRASFKIRRKAEHHVEGLQGALKEAKATLEMANVEVRRWEAEIYDESDTERVDVDATET